MKRVSVLWFICLTLRFLATTLLIAIVFLSSCKKEEVIVVDDEPEKEVDVKAAFSFEVNGPIVSFTNESVNFDRVEWYFGDNKNSDKENPIHEYRGIGTYEVLLKAWKLHWVDSAIITVNIESFDLNRPFAGVSSNHWYRSLVRGYRLPNPDMVRKLTLELASDTTFADAEPAWLLKDNDLEYFEGAVELVVSYDLSDIHVELFKLKPEHDYAARFKLEVGWYAGKGWETMYSSAKSFKTTKFHSSTINILSESHEKGAFEYEVSWIPEKLPDSRSATYGLKFSTDSEFETFFDPLEITGRPGHYLMNLGGSTFIRYQFRHKAYSEIYTTDIVELKSPYRFVSETWACYGEKIDMTRVGDGFKCVFPAKNGDVIVLNVPNHATSGESLFSLESKLPDPNKNYLIYMRKIQGDTLYCNPVRNNLKIQELKALDNGDFYRFLNTESALGIGFRKLEGTKNILRLQGFYFRTD